MATGHPGPPPWAATLGRHPGPPPWAATLAAGGHRVARRPARLISTALRSPPPLVSPLTDLGPFADIGPLSPGPPSPPLGLIPATLTTLKGKQLFISEMLAIYIISCNCNLLFICC